MARIFTRTIVMLSLVSLLADAASEMLYPVMPFFLAQVGMSSFLIGVLEGLANFTSAFGKAYFGAISDHWDRRMPFVRVGYFLAAVARPLMGLWPSAGVVLGARTLDRLGKGLRGGARDAILAEEAGPENRGKVFGFHRTMDTLGAVIGPILALVWLHWNPESYAPLFLLAFIPGMASVFLTLLIRRKEGANRKEGIPKPFRGMGKFWRTAPWEARAIIVGAGFFSLLNSTDLFILMRAGEGGMNPTWVILAYLFFNIVYAAAAFPLGALSDRIGFRPVFVGSVALYGVCYLGFALAPAPWMIFILFGVYGVFMAGNEGVSKAWLSLYLPKDQKATGLGLHQFVNMIALLLASPLTGILWKEWGGGWAFGLTGGMALLLVIPLWFSLPRNHRNPNP